MYEAPDRVIDGVMDSTQFKQKFGIEVKIEFLGCGTSFLFIFRYFPFPKVKNICIYRDFRDTVNSVGLTPKRMPFTRSNTAVKTFRHAVALDEHRAKFRPVHWHAPNQTRSKVVKIPQGELPLTTFKEMFADDSEKEGGKEEETDVDEVSLQGPPDHERLGT